MRMKWTGLIAATALLLTMAGCSKQPFKEVETAPGKAVLYVYWLEPLNENNTQFDVLIGDEVIDVVHDNSYIAVDIAPGGVDVTVQNHDPIAAHLQKTTIRIDAAKGDAKYVKIENPFKAYEVDASAASGEIKKTSLWDSQYAINIDEESATAENTVSNREPTAVKAANAVDEIERLVKLKESGAITQEEYEILKARVIAK